MAEQDWAVIVGIGSYPELGDLDGPEFDAKAFYDWVVSPQGGAVPPDQAVLIVSSGFHPPFRTVINAEPTNFRVQQAFDELEEAAQHNSEQGQGLRTGRRLYLFFAGHGFAPRISYTALATANATPIRAYHVLGRPWAEWFQRAGYFDEVVLFMDCCRESYQAEPILPPWRPILKANGIDLGRVFFGFGTKWSQTTREIVYQGKPRGVFTVALIKGLTGDAEEDGQVTAASLGNYLYNSMKTFLRPEDVADPDIPKEPELVYDPNAGKTFVIVGAAPPACTVHVRFAANLVGKAAQILDGQLRVARSVAAAPAVWTVVLERDMYMAQVPTESKQKRFEVTGSGEMNVDVH